MTERAHLFICGPLQTRDQFRALIGSDGRVVTEGDRNTLTAWQDRQFTEWLLKNLPVESES